MVRASVLNCVRRVCLPFLSGRNPSKQKRLIGNPLSTNAGTKAVAPGRHSTEISFLMHSLTMKKAGSEMPGVPAIA